MTAKEYLSEVQRLQNNIELEQRELQSVRDAATRITTSYSGVKVQSNPNYDKVADSATKIADLEAEIVTDIERISLLRHKICAFRSAGLRRMRAAIPQAGLVQVWTEACGVAVR